MPCGTIYHIVAFFSKKENECVKFPTLFERVSPASILMTQRFPAFQHSSKDHFNPLSCADTSNPSMFVLSLDIWWLVLIAPGSWTNLLVVPGNNWLRNALESTARLCWPKGVKNLLPWGGKSRWDSTLPKERGHALCTNSRNLGKRKGEIKKINIVKVNFLFCFSSYAVNGIKNSSLAWQPYKVD